MQTYVKTFAQESTGAKKGQTCPPMNYAAPDEAQIFAWCAEGNKRAIQHVAKFTKEYLCQHTFSTAHKRQRWEKGKETLELYTWDFTAEIRTKEVGTKWGVLKNYVPLAKDALGEGASEEEIRAKATQIRDGLRALGLAKEEEIEEPSDDSGESEEEEVES